MDAAKSRWLKYLGVLKQTSVNSAGGEHQASAGYYPPLLWLFALTLSIGRAVQDSMLDFHVATQVALQVEFAGAVRTLEGLAAGVKVHVSQEVVHSVERLAAHLRTNKYKNTVRHTHTQIFTPVLRLRGMGVRREGV